MNNQTQNNIPDWEKSPDQRKKDRSVNQTELTDADLAAQKQQIDQMLGVDSVDINNYYGVNYNRLAMRSQAEAKNLSAQDFDTLQDVVSEDAASSFDYDDAVGKVNSSATASLSKHAGENLPTSSRDMQSTAEDLTELTLQTGQIENNSEKIRAAELAQIGRRVLDAVLARNYKLFESMEPNTAQKIYTQSSDLLGRFGNSQSVPVNQLQILGQTMEQASSVAKSEEQNASTGQTANENIPTGQFEKQNASVEQNFVTPGSGVNPSQTEFSQPNFNTPNQTRAENQSVVQNNPDLTQQQYQELLNNKAQKQLDAKQHVLNVINGLE